MKRLSVLVPCYNNENRIRECLESVRWADELLVCDSFSTDRTLAIAAEYSARIIQHEYINSAHQKNWAIPQASGEWILIVDSDERIPSELKNEILSQLEAPGDHVGFKIPRANYVFGRRMRHGIYWPDYQLRLFKKDRGRYYPRHVHAGVELDGPCGHLSHAIIHTNESDVKKLIQKYFILHAQWEAQERLQREKPSVCKLVVYPPAIFIYFYVIKLGLLDGFAGFVTSAIWGMYYFFSYLYMFRWKENG